MTAPRLLKKELAALVGINHRTIRDWTARGYLVPAVNNPGQGKISYYDETNLVQAKQLAALSGMGFGLRFAADIVAGKISFSSDEFLRKFREENSER